MDGVPPSRDAERPERRERGVLFAILSDSVPVDLRLVGRTLLHVALVGAAAGMVSAGFFAGLEFIDRLLMGRLAGYHALRAHGETLLGDHVGSVFRPWILLFLPALGALISGVLTTRFAPEAAGGGGNAMIEAFHRHGGTIRRRILWVKTVASIATLGSGGAGGREGPTMQIGGALGSLVAAGLRVGARERRVLMIAGVAAGMSAIFRTPLGAALLAVEVLYRDDFEADALIPALLASVISYSVFISIFGETTLFAHSPRYPFVPAHLPLYGLLALCIAGMATLFVVTLRTVETLSRRWVPNAYLRPAAGGLMLGVFGTAIILLVDARYDLRAQGLGLFGGGYGAAQLAITGTNWLPSGWEGVQLLLLLCGAKLLATAFTVSTGGSAGDFAPSLALGGLFGGAFGRAAELLLKDPRIDPGAFALVGMGTLYGGIAHVPVGSLVMVCELAGSYDLLVPLMLAEGIAFIALRRRSLYESQLPSQRDSPAHPTHQLDALKDLRVRDVMSERAFVQFMPNTPATDLFAKISDADWQDVFPVIDASGTLVGLVTAETLRVLATERDLAPWTVAADAMDPAVTIRPEDDLRRATQAMLEHSLRQLPVVDDDGHILGFVDEAEVGKAYLGATSIAENQPASERVG